MECFRSYGKTRRNKKWRQYVTSLAAVMSMFSSGIHYGWPSPSLPKLLSGSHPLNLTSDQASYVTTVASAGDIVGNILFTILADIIGRKTTLLLIAPPQILSMIMLYFSSRSKILLYTARFLGGMSEGACICILPIYICEISEPEIRGVLMSFFSIAWYSGSLFVNIVGSYYSIETTSLVTLIFPGVFLGSFVFMSETPYFFLMKNRFRESRLALQKLRRDNVEEELTRLAVDVNRQMSERGKYRDLILIKSNRTALFVMVGLGTVCEFSGITSLTFYSQLFFMETTVALSEDWAASLMILLQLTFTVVSLLIVDCVGRKPLLLSSIGGCCASLTFLSIYFFLHDYSTLDMANSNWIPLAGIIIFQIFFNVGLGNIVNCLSGELFSASVKTKALCIQTIVYATCVALNTKIYQVMSDRYGLGAPLAVFALVQLLGWIFCWKFVPETRGQTLEEIQQKIKGNRRVAPTIEFRERGVEVESILN